VKSFKHLKSPETKKMDFKGFLTLRHSLGYEQEVKIGLRPIRLILHRFLNKAKRRN
jgi:hypothetical protein